MEYREFKELCEENGYEPLLPFLLGRTFAAMKPFPNGHTSVVWQDAESALHGYQLFESDTTGEMQTAFFVFHSILARDINARTFEKRFPNRRPGALFENGCVALQEMPALAKAVGAA